MSRKLSRETAFLLLFEYFFKQDESAVEIYEHAGEYPDFEESEYTKRAFFGTCENIKEIGEIIDKCLVGWSSQRVSCASRAILYLAVYEMLYVEDVPYKVAINEAVELSKKFEGENSYSFVNGVLNACASSLSLK
ncbi:MAG: transcription antitermination factor NusB [Clostridia bacterium]|nr:transcription antitermination factor NusB [Clostridia bacterium]